MSVVNLTTVQICFLNWRKIAGLTFVQAPKKVICTVKCQVSVANFIILAPKKTKYYMISLKMNENKIIIIDVYEKCLYLVTEHVCKLIGLNCCIPTRFRIS